MAPTLPVSNLSLLFLKNAKNFSQLKKSQKALEAGGNQTTVNSNLVSKDNSPRASSSKSVKILLNSFLTMFIKLHGLLFEWNTRMHKTFQNSFREFTNGT
ncbi:MAG: hypothetical protein ACOYOF_04135, partial [Verrucomicrobiaceae bacterium]